MVPVTEIHRTRPFTVYVVTLDDGTELECADRHIVYKNEVDVGLTDTEYILLNFFIKHRGTPNDAKSIYEAVWQERYLPSAANTVMVHILNLRRKIEDDPTQPEIIKTVWGKGYQID